MLKTETSLNGISIPVKDTKWSSLGSSKTPKAWRARIQRYLCGNVKPGSSQQRDRIYVSDHAIGGVSSMHRNVPMITTRFTDKSGSSKIDFCNSNFFFTQVNLIMVLRLMYRSYLVNKTTCALINNMWRELLQCSDLLGFYVKRWSFNACLRKSCSV